jgi:hypothetical protein
MAIIQSGVIGSTLTTIDPTMLALRNAERPPEILGSYGISGVSSALTTAAAAGTVFAFRWAPANSNLVCQIRRVEVGFSVTTLFSTAQPLQYAMFVNRNVTVAASGGTALTPTAAAAQNMYKFKTVGAPTAFTTGGDIRIASSGALTAGTRVPDTNPIGYVNAFAAQTTSDRQAFSSYPIYQHQFGDYPLTLAPNEGFEIQNVILMGAAGVINLTVNVEWMEMYNQPASVFGTTAVQY